MSKNFKKSLLVFILSLSSFFAETYFLKSNLALANEIKVNNSLNNDKYIIGPGDILNLEVFDENAYSGQYEVMKDGNVILPLVGYVKLEGLSLEKATEKISNSYSKELLRPQVYLSLTKARPITVSLLGEVYNPGIYTILPKNNSHSTLIDALQKGGGITKESNLKDVVLIRKLYNQKSNYKKTNLNLFDLIIEGDLSQNPILYDGDIIKIEKGVPLSKELVSIADGNLTPKTVDVYVLGEVRSPGRITVQNKTSLMQAILLAGGPNNLKNNKKIQLYRLNRNGTIANKVFKYSPKQKISSSNNPMLVNGDIIKLDSNLFSKTTSAISVVTEPLSDIISAISIYKFLD